MAPTIKSGYSLGFIGVGNLGKTVLAAALKGKNHRNAPAKFVAGVRSDASREALAEQFPDIIVASNNQEVVDQCDVIVLGVKPYMAQDVLSNLKFTKPTVLVSLLAGTTIATMSEYCGSEVYIVRATTNTSAKCGEGMTALTYQTETPGSAQDIVEWLMGQSGKFVAVEESKQDVCIALFGSGPAFVYLFMEALIDGALKQGLPYEAARYAAAQVCKGAGQMVLDGGHPAVLKSQIMTPAGTTINGVAELEEGNVRGPTIKAVQRATEIAAQFSKK